MLCSRPERIEAIHQEIQTLNTTGIQLDYIIILDHLKIQKTDINLPYPTVVIHTENDAISDANMNLRRQRIADNLNIARQHIQNPDLVWIVEDDTIYPPDILQQMLQHPTPCTAIQAGRHGIKILGLWKITPDSYETLLEGNCDAAGLYCLLTTPKTLQTPFRHDPLSPVGPDVLWCQDNKLHITNTNIHVGHWTPHTTINTNNPKTIKFTKQNNQWTTQIPD